MADDFDSHTELWRAILHYAEGELGKGEEFANNQGPTISKYFGADRTAPWCAAFASWVLVQSYKAVGRILPFEVSYSARRLAKNAARAGCWTTAPEPGALVLWSRGQKRWQGHIGLVSKVIDESAFETIEGNKGRYPSRVRRYVHELGEPRLLGFVRLK
jgi:hypothetical protein